MWQRIADWLRSGGYWPLIWSAVAVALAAVTYLLLRSRKGAALEGRSPSRGRNRMLAAGIVVVALLALAHVWTRAFSEEPEAFPSTTQVLTQNLLWTAVLATAVFLLSRAAQRALVRREMDVEARHKIRLSIAWVAVAVFVVATGFVWARRVENLGVFLGIVGAGVALSLQETLVCLAGWLLLVTQKPYDIGDRIEIDGRVGDVIGISVFQTSLLEVGNWVKADQSTGRMLIVPNSSIIRHAVYNYSKGFPFIWNEFSTVVTFESDWEQAKALMFEKAETEAEKIEGQVKRQIEIMQDRYAIHYDHLKPIVYTSIAAHGVELTLRYLTPVRRRRAITHRISESILRAFLEHPRIDFAYPTTRFFRNTEEGKPAIGGPDPGRPADPPKRVME
ncbi:MAG TPA: mechanosensitive ion channel family protein [Phycisphaerae bacterium]|nr:mechanosensitive ion channel family protein [Phycisphaerae bacterium]HUU22315.1 mechanosensitive ion channel family protein [Phycisphaerae bacterium]